VTGGLVTVLQRLAERHGVNVEPGSVRQRQVLAWVRELGPLVPEAAVGYLDAELERLDSWPKFGELRDACRRAKARLSTQFADIGPDCGVCRGTGWVSFRRRVEADGPELPWSAACLCAAGRRLDFAEPVDRELWYTIRAETQEADGPLSSPERRAAALAYVRSAFGVDPEPVRMVEAILEGKRDDVVRTILVRSTCRPGA
jgi:hypothetical protein